MRQNEISWDLKDFHLADNNGISQVTIEELESKFVPCDITPDMYDTDVDDYTLFLAETFGQPVVADDVEAETEPDPDFIYQVREKPADDSRKL